MQSPLENMLPDANPTSTVGLERLEVRVDEKRSRPTPSHHLLLAFEFGEVSGHVDHDAVVEVGLRPLDRDRVTEAWWYRGPVEYTRSGPIRVSECDEYTVAFYNEPLDASLGIRKQSRKAYLELIGAIRATRHTRMVKIWNYFDDINKGEGD